MSEMRGIAGTIKHGGHLAGGFPPAWTKLPAVTLTPVNFGQTNLNSAAKRLLDNRARERVSSRNGAGVGKLMAVNVGGGKRCSLRANGSVSARWDPQCSATTSCEATTEVDPTRWMILGRRRSNRARSR